MVNVKLIRVYSEDVIRLRKEVRMLLLQDDEHLKDLKMSDAYLFKKVVDNALGK
jgi:hypothetical protein